MFQILFNDDNEREKHQIFFLNKMTPIENPHTSINR